MPVDTDLHKAAHQGDLSTVEDLLKSGEFEVNVKGAAERTPFHRACGGNHLEVMKFLLENDADINIVDKAGRTPMHWACIGGHEQALAILLEKGAKVNVATKSGMTPLHAVAEGKLECTKALVQYSCAVKDGTISGGEELDFAAVDGDGNTAHALAKKGKHKEIEKILKDQKVLAPGEASSQACIVM